MACPEPSMISGREFAILSNALFQIDLLPFMRVLVSKGIIFIIENIEFIADSRVAPCI